MGWRIRSFASGREWQGTRPSSQRLYDVDVRWWYQRRLVHGATDEFGYAAIENKVSVPDLHATILHLMGLNHERLTYRHSGRDYRLTDVSGQVISSILA